ncbi:MULTISPECIES: hypothetical protein [Burkholderiaceae]|jgi:hypothetical protein|uniref:Uncharacterized protein n=2 Tax=Burkholderiaceae TaxID=119060 RepID=A0A6J5JI42_9BURK|nr:MULTISPECIES: hypothetical protein [Burkholderiaceae]ANJ73128.1 hypothetical protein A9Y76_11870 [Ralstonia insidiosa]KAB0601804.1 hypothetical protein F7R19_14995 [Cupriavidus pauculus]MBH9720478.1 hypothetical protein [Burkholderia contaminans]MCO8393872.1 hypothetical protein [Burkholderia cenocepacia]MCO8402228.1 hypothetical protein [Burkholderia cenocepacia]
MDMENLYCELRELGKEFEMKNGKMYFNGEYNGTNFVRYIFVKRDTLELDIYVCVAKKYGEEQTKEDRSASAREKNRWVREEFNKWGLSFKLPEWKPEPRQATPGGSLPQIKSSVSPATQPAIPPANKGSVDDFDWGFVDKQEKDDDNFDPFADHK